jgi:hypothetical protein
MTDVTTSSPAVLAEVGEQDHVLGAASPVLTLVEYGDFGCRFCYADIPDRDRAGAPPRAG